MINILEVHIPSEEGRIQVALEDEQQRGRSDTIDGTDGVGIEDRPGLIPVEQLPCTSRRQCSWMVWVPQRS